MFQPQDIDSRTWDLDIREDDYPVVYLNSKIPDSRTWVRKDPVFVSCVLPEIIRRIFEDILSTDNPKDFKWMNDWLWWADHLMPSEKPPLKDDRHKREWIESLLDSFCRRHSTLDLLLDRLAARD